MRTIGATFAALALAALVAAWWFKLLTWEQHAGYYGPAFSPEGRHVDAVVREAAGFTWGLGREHFTPPEIDKAMNKHIAHDHYTSSAALNAQLAAGGRAFVVRYKGETYRLELRYAR